MNKETSESCKFNLYGDTEIDGEFIYANKSFSSGRIYNVDQIQHVKNSLTSFIKKHDLLKWRVRVTIFISHAPNEYISKMEKPVSDLINNLKEHHPEIYFDTKIDVIEMESAELRNKFKAEDVCSILNEGVPVTEHKEDPERKPIESEEIVLQYPPNSVSAEICRRGATRCFVQNKLYEIYFEPTGVSYEKSGLANLHDPFSIVKDRVGISWTINDHNEAVKLLKVVKDIKEFKAYVLTMNLYVGYTRDLEINRVCFKQIIDYYEATGFLEELSTEI